MVLEFAMNMKFGFSGTMLAAVLAVAGSVAPLSAAVVNCVGTGRTFSIDTTPVSACAAVAALGANNISGNPAGANPDPLFALLGPGLILLDKSDDGISGTNPTALSGSPSLMAGLSGSFSFAIGTLVASAGKEYYNFVLAFKSGGNRKTESVWAAFDLATGVSSGTWTISGKNELSHVNLYAYERDVKVPPGVPVPAAGLMLISGLGAIGAMRRRKSV